MDAVRRQQGTICTKLFSRFHHDEIGSECNNNRTPTVCSFFISFRVLADEILKKLTERESGSCAGTRRGRKT